MINASELRLGNWVLYGNTYVQVNSISNHAINHHMYEENNAYTFSISFGNLEPVLLTPEILEKAGFKYDKQNANFELYSIIISDDFQTLYFPGEYGSLESGFDVNLKYLHELQNLYYSLIREELTINL